MAKKDKEATEDVGGFAEELAALLNKLVANQTISADVATIIQRAASG